MFLNVLEDLQKPCNLLSWICSFCSMFNLSASVKTLATSYILVCLQCNRTSGIKWAWNHNSQQRFRAGSGLRSDNHVFSIRPEPVFAGRVTMRRSPQNWRSLAREAFRWILGLCFWKPLFWRPTKPLESERPRHSLVWSKGPQVSLVDFECPSWGLDLLQVRSHVAGFAGSRCNHCARFKHVKPHCNVDV